jgi:hypothetical protein
MSQQSLYRRVDVRIYLMGVTYGRAKDTDCLLL